MSERKLFAHTLIVKLKGRGNMNIIKQLCWTILIFMIFLSQTLHAQSRDGEIFEQGFNMENKAQSAPEELDSLSFYPGQWDVQYKSFDKDGNTLTDSGYALVYYMNRGHSFIEKFSCPNFDGNGNELNTITFLTFNKANNQWNLGIANSFTESISIYNGDFLVKNLIMKNTLRLGGGLRVTYFRAGYKPISDEQFEFMSQVSHDEGKSWRTTLIKSYTKRKESEDFLFANSSGYGSFAPDLPQEARQFDFLIGEWNAYQDIKLPNGQNPKFPSTSTAVFCLNGHAIMETNWYNIDPALPDAATTIVRIYNRAMHRWECMYLTNRANSILYFGGRKENDKIFLYPFETNTGNPFINHYIFHNIKKDSYDWHTDRSTDHGKTFTTTWKINTTRMK